MTTATTQRFTIVDDPGVTGRLCALWWHCIASDDRELLAHITEDDARDLVAKLTAWLDAPRLAAAKNAYECTDDELVTLMRSAPASVLVWIVRGERGCSSNTIVQHLTGYPALGRWSAYHPLDPSDLRRCMLLLEQCPELVAPFRERMAGASPVWARMVARWDELIAMLREEMQNPGGRAPRTYAAIKESIQ